MAPKTNKSKTATEASASETSAPAPAPAPVSSQSVPVPSPVTEEKPKASKKRAAKVLDEEVVATAATPVVTSSVSTTSAPVSKRSASSAPVVAAVSAPVTDETVSDETAAPLIEQSIDFLTKIGQISQLVSGLKTDFRILEKKWSRELKAAQKQSSRRKKRASNRAPSGFVKPTRISDELALFLGKDKGTEMARTAVTRDINTYIRTNNLQDVSNGRKINPDAKLAALLKLKKTDELTYFNLQKFMSPHFAKSVKPEEQVSVAV